MKAGLELSLSEKGSSGLGDTSSLGVLHFVQDDGGKF
jgi:hypothetical protein